MNAILRIAGAAALALTLMSCSDDNSIQQGLAIGSACTASAQCGTNPPFFCDKDHPNGYCKRDCKVDSDCPTGAVCAHDGGVGACHKKCDTVSDCRGSEGYVCKPASTDPLTAAAHAFCDVMDAAPDDGGAPSDGAPAKG